MLILYFLRVMSVEDALLPPPYNSVIVAVVEAPPHEELEMWTYRTSVSGEVRSLEPEMIM
jgi:hypothetical protein